MRIHNLAALERQLLSMRRALASFSSRATLHALVALNLLAVAADAHAAAGSALSFDGQGQRVRIPDFFTNAPTTEVTVEFWQNVARLWEQSSFCQDDSTRSGWDPSNVFNAHVPYSDGRVYWDCGDIGGEGRLHYVPPVSIVGTWQHFAFVASQSGDFMRIYRDGVLEAEKAGMTPLTRGRFDLNIGGEHNDLWAVSFAGILDEFRIWNVARTEAEIRANLYHPLVLPQANLTAYWRFDEGTGEMAHDATGNGHDGLLVNGPAWVYPDAQNLWIEATYTNVAIGYIVWFTARDTGPMLRTVWDFGEGPSMTNQTEVSRAWGAPGVYTIRLTGYNDSYPSGVATSVEVTVTDIAYYVNPASSNPVSPYTSWQTAARTIQDAVDAALVPGAAVLVTNGVYATGGRALDGAMTNRVTVDKPLALRSVNGPQLTIIEGANDPTVESGLGDRAIRCVHLANGASLSGFTLSKGATRAAGDWDREQSGGGVWSASANEVVTNCVLTGNAAAQAGGGVLGGTINNCKLTGNRAYYGGGAAAATLNNCQLIDNRAEIGGGAVTCSLNNCAVTGNSADIGGGGAHDATLNHCTVTGNVGGTQGGGGVDTCTAVNCIVYDNTAPVYANYDWQSFLSYSCTTPLAAGLGNMEADPQLANTFRLSPSSPCLGSGSPISSIGVDIDGEPWTDPPSVGCDEYHAGSMAGPLSVSIQAGHTNVATSYKVEFTATIDARVSASRWEFGDGTSVSNRPYVSHVWLAAGDYPVTLRAYNLDHPDGATATTMVHVVTQPVHYVAAESRTPAAPYGSWATAAANIQDAVDASSVAGALVLVRDGVYATGGRTAGTDLLANRVVVDKPVAVRSVNGPQLTLIAGRQVPGATNGDGAIRCVYLGRGASLSGFTLTNGATRGSGSSESEQCGGGLRCESGATATNCMLVGNSAVYGGGAAWATLDNCMLANNTASGNGGGATDSTLNNCTLTSNSAPYGGGAYYCVFSHCTLSHNSAGYGGGARESALYNCILKGNAAATSGGGVQYGLLNNCVLTGNAAENGGGARRGNLNNCLLTGNKAVWGGGTSYGTLNNCTLTDNSAEREGGGANRATLNNCIVVFNTARLEGANHFAGTLNYCCTTPLPTTGIGNIDANPRFVNTAAGDLRLRSDSPCVDAGANLPELSDTDFLGIQRVLDGNGDGIACVDMGAYEYNPYRFEPALQLATDGFRFTIHGEPGKQVRIERSRDWVSWEEVDTMLIPASGQTLIDPEATQEPFLFYRAVSMP